MASVEGHRPGRQHTSRTAPVIPPIYQTTTFELDDTSYKDIQGNGGLNETWYSRFNNPTVDAAAESVAWLHGATRALMTSLASLPFNSSHFNMTGAERLEAGIPPGLLRLSVGVEGAEALIEDLRQALAATR